MQVQRLAASYRCLLDTLQRCAPQRGRVSAIVLLTPGPYNETYFEHAYLARYLGIPLVEGSDLTVRDDRVFLKTLHGLRPVHGILRRLDDDFCDPLELRPDSALGVPGLLQAIRAGKVLVANAPGSGFLESPAINGFLPAIAERELGEALRLPSLASWWCGEQAAFGQVAEDLTDKVVKPTYPPAGRQPVLGRGDRSPLDARSARTLRERIESRPGCLHGAGVPTVATSTDLARRRADPPRAAMLRVFAIRDGDDRWHVMPGGLDAHRTARPEDRFDAAGRREPGHLGPDIGAGRYLLVLPTPLRAAELAGQAAHRFEPSRREPVLDGPLPERCRDSVRLRVLPWMLLGDDQRVRHLRVLTGLRRCAWNSGLVPAGVPAPSQSRDRVRAAR